MVRLGVGHDLGPDEAAPEVGEEPVEEVGPRRMVLHDDAEVDYVVRSGRPTAPIA